LDDGSPTAAGRSQAAYGLQSRDADSSFGTDRWGIDRGSLRTRKSSRDDPGNRVIRPPWRARNTFSLTV